MKISKTLFVLPYFAPIMCRICSYTIENKIKKPSDGRNIAVVKPPELCGMREPGMRFEAASLTGDESAIQNLRSDA